MSEDPSVPSAAERLRQRAAAGAGENYQQTWLTPLSEPAVLCPEVSTAWSYLEATHDSVDSLFNVLSILLRAGSLWSEDGAHEAGDSRPVPEYGQDQLRAAIVFTSAGVDTCLKQLLRDALPLVVNTNQEAGRRFRRYIGEQLDGSVSPFMRKAILDDDPKLRLIDLYVTERTAASLQGRKELMGVRATLGITERAIPDDRILRADSFFAARNEIVHELDFLPADGPNIPPQRIRDWLEIIEECDEILQLITTFLICSNDYLRD